MDATCIIGQFIELSLYISPIELVPPIGHELLDVRERGSVFPACVIKLVRKFGGGKLLGELGERRVQDRDLIRLYGRHDVGYLAEGMEITCENFD